jgi:hypothetical protein
MKKFLAVIAGLSVAFLIISIGSVLSIRFFGNLQDLSNIDIESIRQMIGSMRSKPIGLILVILSHAVGSLAGGVTVGRILKEDTMNVGLTLGAILTVLGMVNMILIPTYPEWFYLDFLVFIPLSMFGANYTSQL